jgi:hypothetical protein
MNPVIEPQGLKPGQYRTGIFADPIAQGDDPDQGFVFRHVEQGLAFR